MDRRKRIVEEILQLLACRSVTGDARGIMLCQNLVREHATNLGFETEIVAGGRVLVISPKGLKRPAKLGIVVHLDTVPYESSEWTHNPLGEISSGRIIGRGIIDDKGPITLAMHAFDELHGEIEDTSRDTGPHSRWAHPFRRENLKFPQEAARWVPHRTCRLKTPREESVLHRSVPVPA